MNSSIRGPGMLAAIAVVTCGLLIAVVVGIEPGEKADPEAKSAGAKSVGGKIPPIDRQAPPKTETATFALG